MTWWMWLVLAAMVPVAQTFAALMCDALTVAASAIDRFGDSPEMQVSALLGHVPDRGDDATGDGGRGENAAAGACPGAHSRD